MNWNTEDILKDLKKVLPSGSIISVDNTNKGDHDTNDIIIKSKNGEHGAWCSAYNTQKSFEEGDNTKNPTWNMPYVEIRSFGSDSDGGLVPNASMKTRKYFFILIDYFKTKDVQIIRHYDEIF